MFRNTLFSAFILFTAWYCEKNIFKNFKNDNSIQSIKQGCPLHTRTSQRQFGLLGQNFPINFCIELRVFLSTLNISSTLDLCNINWIFGKIIADISGTERRCQPNLILAGPGLGRHFKEPGKQTFAYLASSRAWPKQIRCNLQSIRYSFHTVFIIIFNFNY